MYNCTYKVTWMIDVFSDLNCKVPSQSNEDLIPSGTENCYRQLEKPQKHISITRARDQSSYKIVNGKS